MATGHVSTTLTTVRRMAVAVSGVLLLAGTTTLGAVAPAGAFTNSQLALKTLSLSGLPTGWSASTFNVLETPPECFSGLEIQPTTEGAKSSASFKDGTTLPLLQEDLGWASKGASADYNLIVRALRRCRKPFAISLGALPATATMEPISYPTYGDRSAAFALGVSFQYDGLTWSTGSDVVIFQVRRVIGLVLYGEPGYHTPRSRGPSSRRRSTGWRANRCRSRSWRAR